MVILGFLVNLSPAWATRDSVSKKKKISFRAGDAVHLVAHASEHKALGSVPRLQKTKCDAHSSSQNSRGHDSWPSLLHRDSRPAWLGDLVSNRKSFELERRLSS